MGTSIRVASIVATSLTLVTRAVAAAPERFGQRGQLAIDQTFMVAATRSNLAAPELRGLSHNSIWLAPAASWFAAERVSLRLGVSFARFWSSADGMPDLGGSTTLLGVSPGVGYALGLGEHFSLWPSASAGMARAWHHRNDQGLGGPSGSTSVSFGAGAPLLWHPAEHLFVGLGPGISWQFSGPRLGALEHDAMAVGLTSLVGGYFSP